MKGMLNSIKETPLHCLQMERELIRKLKLGERAGTKKILQEILGCIYQIETKNIQVIKARVLELALVLSRAAVDGGAIYEQVIEINTKFINEVIRLDSTDKISQATCQVLEQYIKTVSTDKNGYYEQIVSVVKYYILTNYSRTLSLEQIAKAVCLSPYYLCHIFKQVQGYTIIDYLTQVRIEKAKQLLGDPKYNIYEISQRLGYKDPSYFARVFKRQEGRSPSQFRKRA